jgi:D-serine dehydratase
MKETSVTSVLPFSVGPAVLDDTIRGFPAGHASLPLDDIGRRGWAPFDGHMSLPLISLDEAAFNGNIRAMMTYVREYGCGIAPHAKTPMSPAIARRLLDAGAWGTTVADIRQASVMLKAGMSRLILANEIGGLAAARRLARLLAGYPEAEIHIFVDSVDLAEALSVAWHERDRLPKLGILPELGAARAGNRSVEGAIDIAEHVLSRETESFRLTGIAGYEGAAATADPTETQSRIEGLMGQMADLHAGMRRLVGTERELLVTAGGSVYFDLVVGALGPIAAADPHAKLVLRSGAIFFHDHGVYERGLSALDGRRGFEIGGKVSSAASTFKPALRVWAEVLSRPEPDLAICGMGLRDVAMDQGLPKPLALYRDGARRVDLAGAKVTKLNDQHAFVELGDIKDVGIGDVVEFGISHPCTCLDRHGVIYGLGPDYRVVDAYATRFG